jgi:nickel superoxide dismutase
MKMTTKKTGIIATVVLMIGLHASSIQAHCEIPCGIYDDTARIGLIYEHTTTIEKSMNKIIKLRTQKEKNYNQLVRWIQNKELHANKLQEIVYQYFMTQRITPVKMDDKDAYAKYKKELMLLHEMLVYAMKCKQTTDLANVKKLRNALEEFKESYFDSHSHTYEKSK